MTSALPAIHKGLLVDTNLLVLFVVGAVNPQRIKEFKRTSKYTREDYDLLVDVLGEYQIWYSTPHILAEVSNLTDLHGPELELARNMLRSTIKILSEMAIPSIAAAAHAFYPRLGLTDAAIASIAKERGCTVLTDDLDLWVALDGAGVPAINFTHLRDCNWGR